MTQVLLVQRLSQIVTCCDELAPLLSIGYEEFASLPAHFRLAERDVQLVVDSAVDVNNHLILEAGRVPPQKYFDTFLELGRLKILPRALADRLARTSGLRNRIVHEYETVDLRILHGGLRSFERDYRDYARRIRGRAGL